VEPRKEEEEEEEEATDKPRNSNATKILSNLSDQTKIFSYAQASGLSYNYYGLKSSPSRLRKVDFFFFLKIACSNSQQ
jgi:hypothetical protein